MLVCIVKIVKNVKTNNVSLYHYARKQWPGISGIHGCALMYTLYIYVFLNEIK